MIDVLPNPVAVQVGPVPVYWYGIGYAVGLAAAYLVLTRIGRRAGEDDELVGNGMIIVAIAALIGGRLYHVIDQWQLYKDDLPKIVLPPYSGLGVYGGIITGTLAAFLYIRWKRAPFARWADVVAPALFTMQAIARWGNFFNQELYGPPTTLPWGIPIDCAHRIAAYACGPEFPETTAFHPLFLYESISGVLGALFLIWVGYHLRRHLRVGDLLLTFFIWYGVVRFGLESLRADNWTFFGVPTAQVVSVAFIVVAALIMAYRHRPGHPLDDPPTHPEVATWGAIGRAVELTPEGAVDVAEDGSGADDEEAPDDEGRAIDDEGRAIDDDGQAIDGAELPDGTDAAPTTEPVPERRREGLGGVPGPSPG